jgi:hypothetical protein
MEKELEVQVNSLEERFKPLETTDEPELKSTYFPNLIRVIALLSNIP